eukprot:s546_g14.t1
MRVYTAATVFDDDDSPSFHLWRAAGTLLSIETVASLQSSVPGCIPLVADGYIISASDGGDCTHPFPVHNGMNLVLSANPPPDPGHDDVDYQGTDVSVLLDITNLHQGSRPAKQIFKPQARSVGAPLSVAVLSSSELFQSENDAVTSHVSVGNSLMQTSSLKLSPHTDEQDLMLQSFREGHTQPQDMLQPDDITDEASSSGYTPSVAPTGSPDGFPEDDSSLQDVYLYHRHGPPLRVLLHWTDYNTMMRQIVWHFNADRGTLVDAYEVAVTLPDIPQGVAVAIVHFLQDIDVGQDSRLVLVDLEMHGNRVEPHFSSGPLVQRDVWVVPSRISRHGLLARLNIDQYCRLESGRCLLFHNLIRWPVYSNEVRAINHGDHFRVAIPPSEAYSCPTDQLLRFVQRGLSHDEILDQISIYGGEEGFSPSPLSPNAVRQLAADVDDSSSDAFQALQLHSTIKHAVSSFDCSPKPCQCSFTDEFIAAVRAAGSAVENDLDEDNVNDEPPSIFVQEMQELWNTAVEQGRFLHDQPFRVESWYTDHTRHTRCHNSRISLLTGDESAWERQILATWSDRALEGVDTEFAIVYPPPEDIAINVLVQIVVVQRPQYDHRSLILPVYDSDPEIEQPHTFALVLYERIGLEYVLEDVRMTHDCPPIRPQNECLLWFGSYPIRDGQLVHLRHGNALRLYIRRGIPVDLSALHLMTDSQLRRALQDAIWGEIFVRPSYPVAPGEALTLQNFDFSSSDRPTVDAQSSVRDMRPQWIQDLHAVFVSNSFTEQADEGPVIYVMTWFLHGTRRERCSDPQTVRLGSSAYDWRTDIIFPWRTDLERGVPADFVVVRLHPPSQPWQSIAAHVLIIQALPSELSALLVSTVVPNQEATDVHHFACILPGSVTPRDIQNIALPASNRANAATVRRGHHLFHTGQQILVRTGESLVITAFPGRSSNPSEPPVDIRDDQDESTSLLQEKARIVQIDNDFEMQALDDSPISEALDEVDQSLAFDLSVFLQRPPEPSALNPDASVFEPNAIPLPSWTGVIDDIYRVWGDRACSWEGEPRSAFFLTWYVAPGVGRLHCWRSKRLKLAPDFWNWKSQFRQAWRDELDPDYDFEFLLVSPPPRDLEEGIVGHIILQQHTDSEKSAVLVTIYDPAVNDGHHFKAVHVIPFQSCPLDVFLIAGYGRECGIIALCGLRMQDVIVSHSERIAFHDAVACDLIVQRRGTPPAWQIPVVPQIPGTEGLGLFQTKASLLKPTHPTVASPDFDDSVRPRIISVYESLPQDTGDVDNLPLTLTRACLAANVSLATCTMVSVDTGHRGTITSIHSQESFDEDTFRANFAAEHEFQVAISLLHEVVFRRSSWNLDLAAWKIASYQKQPAHLVVVLCVNYTSEGGVFQVRTLPTSCRTSSLRVACRVKLGSFIRCNGTVVSDELTLENGDVLEFHAEVGSNTFSLSPQCSKVQICLEACIFTQDYKFSGDCDAHEILPLGDVVTALEASDSWAWSGLPQGLDIHPSTWEALHCQPDLQSQPIERYELYVDGATAGESSAWAVVAVAITSGKAVFRGCLSGLTEINPSNEQWIGAVRNSNVDAELTAMAVATSFALFCQGEYPALVRPDLSLSRQFSRCSAATTNGHVLARLVQSLGQIAGPSIAVQEVRAHLGNPWNELADKIAKWSAHSGDTLGIVPWQQLHALAHSPLDLAWSWLPRAPPSARLLYPALIDGCIWQPQPSNLVVGADVSWVDRTSSSGSFSLKFATYNALALSEPVGSAPVVGSRSARLDHQFHVSAVNVVGVQEARTTSGIRHTDHYVVYASGFQQCGNARHYGCELWFHRHLPVATLANGTKILFGDCNVLVIRSDPRFLAIRVEVIRDALDLYFIAAHAPCITADRPADQVSTWWQTASDTLASMPAGSPVALLLDANAPLADEACEYYGITNAEQTNPAGSLFQGFLQRNELFVPSTFDLHTGSGATWRHPRGQLLRRDYVVLNACAFQVVVESSVLSDFDGGFGHVDHWPSVASVRGLIASADTQHRLKWNKAKFKDPVCCASFEAAVRTLPTPSWAVSIDDHAKILETNVVQVAQQHFCGANTARQRPVLTEATVNGIQLKRQILDLLRTPAYSTDPVLLSELKEIEKFLKPMVRRDQQNWYDEWINGINESDDRHDTAALYKQLIRLGRKKGQVTKGPRPLPQLRLRDGSFATSFQVCQETWRKQFSNIEAGLVVDELQLAQLHVSPELPAQRDIGFCPGPCDVLATIRKFKNGKVPGPGGLPVDVLKAGGFALAQLLTPLLVKSCWNVREPITWKGGLLVPLFKGKGSASDPEGYRSIFVSDVCAKVHHARVRTELAQLWGGHDDLIQQGGKKGCSTDVAHHILHAYSAWAREKSVSCGILFVDLQSAFYSVMRSSLFKEEMHDDLICRAVADFGIRPDEWNAIRQAAADDYAVQGIHPQIESILQDMFSATHFSMKGIPTVTATTRGTRPGDPVADILFNLAFRLVVLDARQRFVASSDLAFVGSPLPAADVLSPPNMPAKGFAEVSFVDDLAYVLHSSSAESLVGSLQTVASCLHDAVHHRGLKLNYGVGKTEAMLRLAGHGSRLMKTRVWHELGGRLPVVTEHTTQCLRLVHSYKHLGSFMQDHAVVTKDYQYRISQARKAYGQLARPFYAKRNVHDHTKALVFSQLVLSRLLYNVHTWSWYTDANLQTWQNGIREAVAGLARNKIRPVPAFGFTTAELCALMDLNCPLDLLYANCLRYVRRAIVKAPAVLWSLLWDTTSNTSWFSLLQRSLAWLQRHATRPHGISSDDVAASLQAIVLNESWNGLIRSTLKSSLAYVKAVAEGKLWTQRFQSRFHKLSTLPLSVSEDSQGTWRCGQCDLSFASKRALAMHARHKHDYQSILKRYVFGDECLACGKKFFSRCRLLAHVKAVVVCRASYISCFCPAPSEVVDAAAAEDLQYASELRAQGWLPTKAFLPPVRVFGPYLPLQGSEGAANMQRRSGLRNGTVAGDEGLDGFHVVDSGSAHSSGDILPFLYQSYGGADPGKCGVFQCCDLAAEAARLHVTCYIFIHFYSGFRREGDLQHCIEHQATISHQHLFCISIDLCLAKQHSDLTSSQTKAFWIDRMRSGQILGVGGGPSCETWSAARHNPGGPLPLRSYDEPWGLPGVRARARVQLAVGTCLVQFLVDLLLIAAELGLCGFLEHPAFPTWILRKRPASIWMLTAIRLLARCQCFQTCTFDQCIFDLPAKKPTTLLLLRLDAFRSMVHGLGNGSLPLVCCYQTCLGNGSWIRKKTPTYH